MQARAVLDTTTLFQDLRFFSFRSRIHRISRALDDMLKSMAPDRRDEVSEIFSKWWRHLQEFGRIGYQQTVLATFKISNPHAPIYFRWVADVRAANAALWRVSDDDRNLHPKALRSLHGIRTHVKMQSRPFGVLRGVTGDAAATAVGNTMHLSGTARPGWKIKDP